MNANEISKIRMTEFSKQTDETLKDIMAFYAEAYGEGYREGHYRVAFELLQLRRTEKLVKATWALAIFTILLAIATIVASYLSKP